VDGHVHAGREAVVELDLRRSLRGAHNVDLERGRVVVGVDDSALLRELDGARAGHARTIFGRIDIDHEGRSGVLPSSDHELSGVGELERAEAVDVARQGQTGRLLEPQYAMAGIPDGSRSGAQGVDTPEPR